MLLSFFYYLCYVLLVYKVGVIKSIVVLFLAVRILMPVEVLHSFEHFSDISKHFQIHQSEEQKEETLFISFVVDHLGGGNHNHKNKQAHDNLPFHHTHSAESTPTLNFVAFKDLDLRQYEPIISSSKVSSKQHFYTSAYLKSIWQPPKLG